jgi:hypothetical protein
VNPQETPQPERQSVAVEYAHDVLDEVRAYVTGNFERGLESGGVLFGTHSRRIVTVTEMRPAACSYASGPVFVLSPGDHSEFEQIVALHKTDPALEGMEPVGWFLSHVRDSLVLRPADREIFDRYFDQPWQMVLVMRPGRVGSLRAATIGRLSDSRGEAVLNEFTIKQAPGTEAAPALDSDRVTAEPPGRVAVDAPGTATAETPVAVKVVPRAPLVESVRTPIADRPVHAPASPTSIALRNITATVPFRATLPSARRNTNWAGWAVVACLLLVIALAAVVFLNANAHDNVGLQAFERDGVLHIEWNPDARSVAHAARAKLEITDGGLTSIKDLTREDLRRGLFAVVRKQADVTARLTLVDGSGNPKEEQTRYIGRPIIKEEVPKPPPVVERSYDDSSSLQRELARERQRAEELDRRVKVLQTIIQRRETK